MQSIPHDISILIFGQLSSKTRSHICSVSKQICVKIIAVSMELAPRDVRQLYTRQNGNITLPLEHIVKDYHLFARLNIRIDITVAARYGHIDVVKKLFELSEYRESVARRGTLAAKTHNPLVALYLLPYAGSCHFDLCANDCTCIVSDNTYQCTKLAIDMARNDKMTNLVYLLSHPSVFIIDYDRLFIKACKSSSVVILRKITPYVDKNTTYLPALKYACKHENEAIVLGLLSHITASIDDIYVDCCIRGSRCAIRMEHQVLDTDRCIMQCRIKCESLAKQSPMAARAMPSTLLDAQCMIINSAINISESIIIAEYEAACMSGFTPAIDYYRALLPQDYHLGV